MHTLKDLTTREIQMVLSALMVVSPSGGGSEPLNLWQKIHHQTPEVEADLRLDIQFINTVMNEFIQDMQDQAASAASH